MKTQILILFIATSFFIACNQNGQKINSNEQVETKFIHDSDTVLSVYYFHSTHRCPTCYAVENVTKEALKEFFGDKITLQTYNFQEDSNKALVERFQISGQTLLIVKGDKKVDLTNYAFINATSNPNKLKEKIIATIKSM